MTIGDLMFYGGLWGFFGSMGYLLFLQFFLNQKISPDRMDGFWHFWYVSLFIALLGVLVKYSGNLKLKYSKKKCIKCKRPSAMGSLYCDFHAKQARKDLAFEKGVLPQDDDDENLGY